MKVAIISPYDLAVPGGVQAHTEHLAVALRRLDDEVTVVGPHRSVNVTFNGSVAPIGLVPGAGRRLEARLRELAPDVVHVHEPLVPWVGLAAARTRVAPTVGTFHAWSDRDRVYRLARPLGRRILGHLDAVLAVSSAAAGYHAGALGVPSERFTIVPNGVVVERFAGAEPLAEVTDPSRPTLLFVGRLERRKGLATLIEAFPRLKEQHPQVRLLVVGEGSERQRCERLLPARWRDDVTFLGRVDNDQLPGIYAACDIYVSPALGGESFGIVLLEAMAAGRAIVASDIPGYRSVLTDGREGRLVPPGDPMALADVLGEYVDDRLARRSAGEAGARTAAGYDWTAVAEQVRSHYLAVASGEAGRG